MRTYARFSFQPALEGLDLRIAPSSIAIVHVTPTHHVGSMPSADKGPSPDIKVTPPTGGGGSGTNPTNP